VTILTDTNVLVEWIDERRTPNGSASAAIDNLLGQGHGLAVASQNLVELWNVCTRPVDVRGLGLDPTAAAFALDRIEQEFVRLPDADGIYNAWRRLVRVYGVSGRQVHDTRLVASRLVYHVTHILTFNGRDFARYTEIEVIDPLTVA
jgi:predicted nucleic acid-binding protein